MRKKTIIVIVSKCVVFLFIAIFVMSCEDKNENSFRPGSSQKPAPPSGLDFSKLTVENHPRLLMNADEFEQMKLRINGGTDKYLVKLHNVIMDLCDKKGMSTTLLTYKLDASNKRILDVSRNALLRIFTCSYAYRMTGDKKYLKQAETDINAVCDFTDWNASRHFLDVGEMATAVAFGYDWLYKELSEGTRKKASKALSEFAFKPAQAKVWNLDFYSATNNWNQVCNGGLVCAALASYEANAEDANFIITKALETNKSALEVMYSPDGNYPEGSGYWCYGTSYQVLMIAALESCINSDDGLSGVAGFSKTAEYMLYMNGLNNKFFNYSDCAQTATPALASWWFASKYSNSSLLYNELKMLEDGKYASSEEARLLPMLISFAKQIDLSSVKAPTNKVWSGKGETPVVLVRTDWTMSDTDKYLGIKGGKASTSHGHMDAGSFVYDAYGVRWSMDFGLQSYTTLENEIASLGGNVWDMGQNSMRWDIFRLNNLNHSTISINDAKHRVNGVATLTSVIDTGAESGGIFNLTDVLSDQVSSVFRTVKIVDNKDLVVIDDIKARTDKVAKLRWCMVTPAIPSIDNDKIVLTNGNKIMHLTTSGNLKVTYKIWSSQSEKSYDLPNPGTYMVGFEVVIPANQSTVFTTKLTPKLK